MKKLIVIIASIFFGSLYSIDETILRKGTKEVVLKSGVLSLVDGSFINADTIELMRKCQRQYLIKLIGQKKSDGSRKGLYLFEGSYYSIHELVEIEKEQGLTPTLKACLKHAKENFIKTSNEFRMVAAGSKSIIAELMKESLSKRGRLKSKLLLWAQVSESHEDSILYEKVHTFAEFQEFIVDLLNFQNDLVNSCPKAQQQFKNRVIKFNHVKTLLPKISTTIDAHTTQQFLLYTKQHINSLPLHDISEQKVLTLYKEFCKTKK